MHACGDPILHTLRLRIRRPPRRAIRFRAATDGALTGRWDQPAAFVGLGQYNAQNRVGGVKRAGWGYYVQVWYT